MAEQKKDDSWDRFLNDQFGEDGLPKKTSGNLATDIPKAAARGISRIPDVLLQGAQTAASGYAKAIDAARGNTDSGHISDLEAYAQRGISGLRDVTTRKLANAVDESLPYSQGTQQAQAELSAEQQRIARDKSLGTTDRVLTSIGAGLSNPRGSLPSVAESIPQFLVGAQALKAAKVAEGLGAAGQSTAITGLGNFALEGEGASRGANQTILSLQPEQLRQNKNFLDLERRFGFDRAQKIAAEEAGTKAYGPAAALGAGASLLTGGGLEGALINRSLGVNKAAGSIVKGLAQGALKEGGEEALQGASGQIAQNLAEQPYTGVDTFDQVPEQAGLGAAIGALSGGVGGGVGSTYDAAKEAIKPKGPLSEAVAKGAEVAPPAQPGPEIKIGPLAGAPEPEGISEEDARTVQPGSSIDIGATPEADNVADYTGAFDEPSPPGKVEFENQAEEAKAKASIARRMAELRELKNHGADNRTVNIDGNAYDFNTFVRDQIQHGGQTFQDAKRNFDKLVSEQQPEPVNESTPLQNATKENQAETETQSGIIDAEQAGQEQADRQPDTVGDKQPVDDNDIQPVRGDDRPEPVEPAAPVSGNDNIVPEQQQTQVQQESSGGDTVHGAVEPQSNQFDSEPQKEAEPVEQNNTIASKDKLGGKSNYFWKGESWDSVVDKVTSKENLDVRLRKEPIYDIGKVDGEIKGYKYYLSDGRRRTEIPEKVGKKIDLINTSAPKQAKQNFQPTHTVNDEAEKIRQAGNDYQLRSTEVQEELINRGDIGKLHKYAGLKKNDSFNSLPLEEQAKAYQKYIADGNEPVKFKESYNEKIARQERDVIVRQKQSQEEIKSSNGKPFKTSAAAEKHQSDFDLGISHDVKQVDGGFILKRSPIAIQAEKQRIRDGKESYIEAQSAVVKQLGLTENEDGEIDATDEQWETIDKLTKARLDRQELNEAAHQAATSPLNDLPEPTEKQKKSGNYKKGPVKFQGLDIAIENPAGSVRSGTDKNGKTWSNTLNHHYGYIKRSEGADGDEVDVFIGDKSNAKKAYVVNQIDPETGEFDEHKIMLGFYSKGAAEKAYNSNYADGWKGLKDIVEMPVSELKERIERGEFKKPVKKAEVAPEPTDNNILSANKKSWINNRAKETGVKKGSPGYKQALEKIGEEYDSELDKALAALPFDEFSKHPINKDVSPGLLRQSYDALRDENGISDKPSAEPYKPNEQNVKLFEKLTRVAQVNPSDKRLKDNPNADIIAMVQNHWTDVVSDYVYGNDDGTGKPFDGKKGNKVERIC